MSASKYPDIWKGFSFDQISLLIQLRYAHKNDHMSDNRDHISRLISDLGFNSEIISKELKTNLGYYWHLRRQLDANLQTLQVDYENTYGIRLSDLDFNSIEQELASGIPQLKIRAVLSNPFNILAVERHFRMPETGSWTLFMENWNKTYYTPQGCGIYNSPEVCLIRAARYGDLENFARLYPSTMRGYLIGSITKAAIQNGQVNILEYILEHDDDGSIMRHIITHRLFLEAVESKYDNRQMIKYLLSLPGVRGSGIMSELSLGSIMQNPQTNQNNVEYLFGLSPPSDVDQALSLAARRGWTRVVQMLMSHFKPTQGAIDRAFEYAAAAGHDETVKFLRPYIDADVVIDYIFADGALSYGRKLDNIRYIVNLPEVSKADIIKFLKNNNSRFGLPSDELRQILLQSGKITSEEINEI